MITRWVCHRCRASVTRKELAGDETPPGWATLVIVDPPLADPTIRPDRLLRQLQASSCNRWLQDQQTAVSVTAADYRIVR